MGMDDVANRFDHHLLNDMKKLSFCVNYMLSSYMNYTLYKDIGLQHAFFEIPIIIPVYNSFL